MSDPQQVLTPYLAVADAKSAIVWYGAVFGAELDETEYYEMEEGEIGHATMRIGATQFFLSDEFPQLGAVAPSTVSGSTVALVLQVADVDALWQVALDNGAEGQRPPTDQMGFRSCWFLDPWGHRWSASGPTVPD